jgi:hypothetical protein
MESLISDGGNKNDLPASLDNVDTLANRQAGAEALFTGLEWIDEVTAFCKCPGQSKHTGPNGPKDCQVKIDGAPTVYCVHASCADKVAAANKALRAGIHSGPPLKLTPEQKKAAALAIAKARQVEELKVRTTRSLASLLKTYAWPYDKIVADNPNPIHEDDWDGMFKAFLDMFKDDDVIWVGDVSQTGKPHHAAHFKTKSEWLAGLTRVGPFTCPSSFLPGSYSRSKENVAAQRYLVVESDTLSKNEVGAIFRWLDQKVELPLRAVVDTAGKSLHGWFDYPPDHILADLKIMLPVMGCDPKMFGASQPCRLPGGLRDGRTQRLIYSKNGGCQ